MRNSCSQYNLQRTLSYCRSDCVHPEGPRPPGVEFGETRRPSAMLALKRIETKLNTVDFALSNMAATYRNARAQRALFGSHRMIHISVM